MSRTHQQRKGEQERGPVMERIAYPPRQERLRPPAVTLNRLERVLRLRAVMAKLPRAAELLQHA